MFQRYVASVSYECCKRRSGRCIYVAMSINVCCKRLFQMFHLFFRHKLQVCLSGCCIHFTHMLQVFHLDIAYACNGFQVFRECFKRILQVFHLFRTYVASVSSICCKSRSGVAHVANALRSGGGLSGPCARYGGVGSTWGRETQARARASSVGTGVRTSGR
jgi:hypothetical protein